MVIVVTPCTNTTNPHLELKIKEFKRAIETYNTVAFYAQFQLFISSAIVLLQLVSIFNLLMNVHNVSLINLTAALVIAYVATDFVNGIIHMIMDNNTHYTTVVGPLIAAFHLHHSKPVYEIKHPIKVYFYESGQKDWLAVYLIVLVVLQQVLTIPESVNAGLVLFGILSSVAEVSHYWCHNSQNKFIRRLQKARLLLPLKHHSYHHRHDNTHYAFLNGMSDPLINKIARFCYSGYKNDSDKHVEAYVNLG